MLGQPTHYVKADRVVRWDPLKNTILPVADLTDHFNPQSMHVDTSVIITQDLSCNAGENMINDVYYWLHASGVTVGLSHDGETSLYVVSLRSLNAVAAFRADGDTAERTGGRGEEEGPRAAPTC